MSITDRVVDVLEVQNATLQAILRMSGSGQEVLKLPSAGATLQEVLAANGKEFSDKRVYMDASGQPMSATSPVRPSEVITSAVAHGNGA